MVVWWGWCSIAQRKALGTCAGASLHSHLLALANATDTAARHASPLEQKQASKRVKGGGRNQNAEMESLLVEYMGLFTERGRSPLINRYSRSSVKRAFVFVHPHGMGLVLTAAGLNLALELVHR